MDAIITLIIILVLSGFFDKQKKQQREDKRRRRVDEQREKMLQYQREQEERESAAELDAAERRARLQELRRRAAVRRAAEAAEDAAEPAVAQPRQQSFNFGAAAPEGPQAPCYGAENRHSPLMHRPAPTSQPRPTMPRVGFPHHVQKRQNEPCNVETRDLTAALKDREQLRRAVILNEVLGPPKALRKRR